MGLAAVLHDIGRVMALRSLAEVLVRLDPPVDPEDPHVDAALDATHVELGIALCGGWSLPDYALQVCALLHDAKAPRGDEYTLLHIVRIVSALNELRVRPYHHDVLLMRALDSQHALGLSGHLTRALVTELGVCAARVTGMFDIPDPSAGAN